MINKRLQIAMGGKKKDKKKQIEQKRQERRKQKQLFKKMKKKMYSKGDAFKLTKEYIKYYEQFNAQLEHLRLKLKDVGGDGNCLFRAIADQIDGSEATHLYLREQACKYIVNNQQFFKNFLDEDQDGTFEAYVQGMRKNGEWGGNLQLQALSECMRCIIVIHKRHMQSYQVTPIMSEPSGTLLHLAYFQDQDFEHYLSIRDIDDNSQDPAINKLKYLNKNMYQHLLQFQDPQEMALRKQIQQISLNDQYDKKLTKQDYQEGEGQYQYYYQQQPAIVEPYPGLPPNKKCKCGSNQQYKNCCLKEYHKKMAKKGYS